MRTAAALISGQSGQARFATPERLGGGQIGEADLRIERCDRLPEMAERRSGSGRTGQRRRSQCVPVSACSAQKSIGAGIERERSRGDPLQGVGTDRAASR